MEKANIDQSKETEKINYYLKRSMDAFDSALFITLCCFDKNEENTFYISEKANAIIGKDDMDNLIGNNNNVYTKVITMADADVLGYLFSKFDNALSFVKNCKDLSFVEDIKKWVTKIKSEKNYNEHDRQEVLSEMDKYFCFLYEEKTKIEAASFCIVTGEELKTIRTKYIFDSDCIYKSKKGNIISIPEQERIFDK